MLLGRWNEKSPFYWEGPGRRTGNDVVFASLSAVGLDVSGRRLPCRRLKTRLRFFCRPTRGRIIGRLGNRLRQPVENTPLSTAQVDLPQEWAGEYAYPDGLHHIQRCDGIAGKTVLGICQGIPGRFRPYWEDGLPPTQGRRDLSRKPATHPDRRKDGCDPVALLNPELRPDARALPTHGTTCCSSTSTPGPPQAPRRSPRAIRTASQLSRSTWKV